MFPCSLSERLALFVGTPDDSLECCAMQFVRYLKGRTRANEVAESYNRYYALRLDMAKQEGTGGIPARHVLTEQTVIFDGLAVSLLNSIQRSAYGASETLWRDGY